MARPNPAAREAILNAAQQLMIAKGYAATTVDQICEAADGTKGTFFHYFESKEAVAMAALHRFARARNQAFGEVFVQETDPLKRFDGFVEFVAASFQNPIRDGCLVGMLTMELSDTHPDFRAVCRTAFSQTAVGVKGLLDEVKARYGRRTKVDTASLAELFVTTAQGGLLVSKAKGNASPLRAALQHYKAYVHAVLVDPRRHN
jgi:TetR/AcrR family transcriptional repressor of nem operon